MADYGLKIAQPGYDVETASDQHLVMTSKLNSHKIQTSLQGTAAVSMGPGSGGTISVIHNLNYFPAYDAWFSDENGSWHPIMNNDPIYPSTTTNIYAPVGTAQVIGTDKLTISLYNRSFSNTYIGSVYYIIFLDSIT